MPIDLTEFERGDPFDGDYDAQLGEVQQRLADLQLSQVVHRKRVLIIFEGWSCAGKKAALKRLSAAWDPVHVTTRFVGGNDQNDDDRHWLAPFWSALPAAGDTTIFFRSWYRQLVDDRANGRIDAKRWSRACDEINEFESQQRDHGTLILKLFFHVSAECQQQRWRELQADPWRRHLLDDSLPTKDERARTAAALQEMFALTDTRWAPWQVIDSNDKHSTRLGALTILANALGKAMPAEPPATGDTVLAFPRQKSAQSASASG